MKIIGYTTGTYDLFHAGHVEFLKKAKALCDILIVGCTDDDLGFKEKGKRPIIPIYDRMKVVESCKYVDMVIIHDGSTKEEMCEQLGFSVVFIGSDWYGHDSYKNLEKIVKVVYLPYTKSISSTKIREKLS